MTEATQAMNEHGQIYFSRNGRLLCSPRNPVKEAEEWLRRQKLDDRDHRALILGVGAGYHITALTTAFPDLKIELLELDTSLPKLQNLAYVQEKEVYSKNYDVILAFRPCWAGFESKYLDLYLKLTGRDQDLIQLKMKNEKIWYCLQELVK